MFTKNTFIFFFILSCVIGLIKGTPCNELSLKEGISTCDRNDDGSISINIYTGELTQDTVDSIGAYSEIEKLIIYHTEKVNVTSFEPFTLLTNLTTVEIRTDGIQPVTKNLLSSFKSIKKLQFIDIELNQENIEELSTLTNLETLAIRHSSCDPSVDYSPLKKLVNLEVLYMEAHETVHHNYNKKLTEFPDFIFELTNLREIFIAAQEITKLPEEFSKLKKLEILDISDNKIDDDLPESFNDLPELKILFASNNVNLKGKTLTNPKLEKCSYDENYELCKAKDMDCLKLNRFEFKNCSGMVTEEDYSTNGQCGNGNGKCPPGFCCSKYGWCGKTEDHCSISKGCQADLGVCEDEPLSSRCGKVFGKCPSGQCCSKDGYCGVNDNHCLISEGCQSEFGLCNKLKYTVDGRCGPEAGRCPSGQCCSRYGWCGQGSIYCNIGCQSEFGDCNKN